MTHPVTLLERDAEIADAITKLGHRGWLRYALHTGGADRRKVLDLARLEARFQLQLQAFNARNSTVTS